ADLETRLVHDVFLYRVASRERVRVLCRRLYPSAFFLWNSAADLGLNLRAPPWLVAKLQALTTPRALVEALREDAVIVLALLSAADQAIDIGEALLEAEPDNLWLHHSLLLLYATQMEQPRDDNDPQRNLAAWWRLVEHLAFVLHE